MISIIIIVKNDRGVDNTLHHLTKVIDKPPDTEIIVVDASEGKLDDLRKKYPSANWIQFAPIAGKKITIPHQRNVGVKAAKGDIIVFIDASCIPEKHWLKNLCQPILSQGEFLVGGNTQSSGNNNIRDYTSILNHQKKYIIECPTLNMAVKKDIFHEIGYFDEMFESGEDVDFCWRYIKNGHKIRYQANAIVKHNWGNWKDEILRSFKYGMGRVDLYAKHHDMIGNLFRQDINVLIYPLFIIGLPTTLFNIYYPLILLIPILKNYRHKPFYTVTEHLIYGVGVLVGISKHIKI